MIAFLLRFFGGVRTTTQILSDIQVIVDELKARQESVKELNNERARTISQKQDEIDAIEADCESGFDEINHNATVVTNIQALLGDEQHTVASE